MKIAIGVGHTLTGLGSGAVGLLNESVEVRKIGIKVTELLKYTGHEVLYLQVDKPDSYKGENYKTRVQKANEWGCDLYVEIHLNCGGGYGSEVYTYAGNEFTEAKQILNNICALGYRNRGIKNGNSLYIIKNTKMKSCLVECLFCDSKSDVNLYTVDTMAKAIAEGIIGKKIICDNIKPSINKNKHKNNYKVNYCLEFQKWYNEVTQTKAQLKQDGIYGPATERAINTIKNIIENF